jgi:chemotaxis protein histidine kinase CheA/CheY-like chemotaxis protein
VLKLKEASMEQKEADAVTFLIVDDEDYTRRTIITEIGKLMPEARFYEARDGNEALEELGKHTDEIALITLDINMPNRNGYDFLMAKRENPNYSSIKVLVISTEESKQDFPKLEQLGANLFCEKPATAQILAPVLRTLLNREIELPKGLSPEERFVLSKFYQQLRMFKMRSDKGDLKTAHEVYEGLLKAFQEDFLEPQEKMVGELRHVLKDIEVIPHDESKDGIYILSRVMQLVEGKIGPTDGQETDVQETMSTLEKIQNHLNRLELLLTQGGQRTEILNILSEIFQKLHNVKGHPEPPLLHGVSVFVNAELMNLARDFSNKGAALLLPDYIDRLSNGIDWLSNSLRIEHVLRDIQGLRKTIPVVSASEREAIIRIMGALTGRIDPSAVERSEALVGLVGAIRSGVNIFKVQTSPIKHDEKKTITELAEKHSILKVTDYEERLPEQDRQKQGKRYEFLLFSEIGNEDEIQRIFGEWVERVQIVYRGIPVEGRTKSTADMERRSGTTIPIRIEVLEEIYQNVEKLSMSKSEIYEIRNDVEGGIEPGVIGQELDEAIKSLDQITRAVQDRLIKSRLVPLEDVFRNIRLRAKENSEKHKQKNIQMDATGEQVKLDKKITDELGEHINILIDNAYLHGFKKKAGGKISVCAEAREGNVVITVEDNGDGLDNEAIRQKAIQKGILKEGLEYTPEETHNCIFTKGFSTAERESDLGGKGIGMYSIKRWVEKSFGKIRVQSEQGKGTTFVMEFPNAISIVDVLLVTYDGNIYAVPLKFVLSVKTVQGDRIHRRHKDFYFWEVGNEELGVSKGNEDQAQTILPIVDISKYLGNGAAGDRPIDDKTKYNLVVLHKDDEIIGILVDEALRREQIVLRHMGEYLLAMQQASAGEFAYHTYTVLGDGTLVPVLNVHAILDLVPRVRTQIEAYREELKYAPRAQQVAEKPDMFCFFVGTEYFVIEISKVRRSFFLADVRENFREDAQVTAQFGYVKGFILGKHDKFVVVDVAAVLGIQSGVMEDQRREIVSVQLENGNIVGLLVDGSEGIIRGWEIEETSFEGENQKSNVIYYVNRSTQALYKKFNLSQLCQLPRPPEMSTAASTQVDSKRNLPTKAVGEAESLLLFELSDWKFAIESSMIYSVRLMDESALGHKGHLPRFEGYVAGLVNVNGNATPYIHLKKRLWSNARTGEEKNVVVVRMQDEKEYFFGFIVDEVLRTLASDDFVFADTEKIPPLLDTKYVERVGLLRTTEAQNDKNSGSSDGNTFFVLDVGEILKSIKEENTAL